MLAFSEPDWSTSDIFVRLVILEKLYAFKWSFHLPPGKPNHNSWEVMLGYTHESLIKSTALHYLWSCDVERGVGQFKPLLGFLSGQAGRLLHLFKLLCKLQAKWERRQRSHSEPRKPENSTLRQNTHTLQFTAEEYQDTRDKICLVHCPNIVTADPCKYFFICQVIKLIVVIVILQLHHSNIHNNKLHWTLT